MSTALPAVDHELTREQFKERRNDFGNPFWAHRTLQDGSTERVLAYRCMETGKVAYVRQ